MDADVVVVGGGSAGLQAALTLGRMRFDVVVVDEGRPSNAPAHAIGGLLGAHEVAPLDLLAAGRERAETGRLTTGAFGHTAVAGVYVAGALVAGPPAVVQALATAQRAAVGITRELTA
jgi:thioredoxin reductase